MIQLKDNIYWVGVIDWNVRNFHGHLTSHGTTYNSYILKDEKTALVDMVREPFFPDMLQHIKEIVDPSDIDYIIVNHIEPDHSGSLARTIDALKNAELIASDKGKAGLQRYFGTNIKCTTISEKPSLSLGRRTLQFVATPMLHWPDSMVTYIPEEKLLLSNDAFGQHYAASGRFDDEAEQAILWQEAARYYANIVMPLWKVVLRALEVLGGLKIEMIAPSHGIIWRDRPGDIVQAYKRWADGVSSDKVVIVYDTMWGSTERIAKSLEESISAEGVKVNVHKLGESHISDVVTDILDAKAVLVGSPTLNGTLFPTVAYFLSYLKGLRPKDKIGAFFGSYGWGGGAKKGAEDELRAAGIEVMESGLDFVYRPNEEELKKAREFGKKVAEKVKFR